MFLDDFISSIKGNRELIYRYITETQQRYITEMKSLIGSIKPPKILFWFSDHSPPDEINKFEGDFLENFPQLVDSHILDSFKKREVEYVECYKVNTGNNAIKFDRDYGAKYYPSQEMHNKASRILYKVIKRMGYY